VATDDESVAGSKTKKTLDIAVKTVTSLSLVKENYEKHTVLKHSCLK
jgi:hypothetical protein